MHFPALVKGWMERVLTYGFAYKLIEKGWRGDPDGRIPFNDMNGKINEPFLELIKNGGEI